MSSMNSSKVLLLAVGSVTCQAGFYPLDVTAEWGAGKNFFFSAGACADFHLDAVVGRIRGFLERACH